VEGLLEVIQSFTVESHSYLQFAQVCVNLCSHNMARAQNF